MNLKYSILWFEDDPDWYKSILPDIQEYLDDKGFILEANRYSNDENKLSTLKNHKFDFILIDYNLANQKGDEIISKIRNYEIYTDVLFYSQGGETILRKTTAEKGLDGVFCADRERDNFLDKVFKIIDTTLKKVEDVTNTRGLVIAETIDLENRMLNILQSYLLKSSKEDLDFLEKIKTNKIQITESNVEKLRKSDFQNLDYIFENELLTTNDVYDSILICLNDSKKRIGESLNGEKDKSVKVALNERLTEIKSSRSNLTSFFDEVIQVRNTLAHVKEDINTDGLPILRNINPNKPEIVFDRDKYREIRQNLKKHLLNFNGIDVIFNS